MHVDNPTSARYSPSTNLPTNLDLCVLSGPATTDHIQPRDRTIQNLVDRLLIPACNLIGGNRRRRTGHSFLPDRLITGNHHFFQFFFLPVSAPLQIRRSPDCISTVCIPMNEKQKSIRGRRHLNLKITVHIGRYSQRSTFDSNRNSGQRLSPGVTTVPLYRTLFCLFFGLSESRCDNNHIIDKLKLKFSSQQLL